jgi:hypothetical protein
MHDVRDAVNTLMDISDRPENHVNTVTAKRKLKYNADLINQKIFIDSEVNVDVFGNYVRAVEESLRVKWRFRPNAADLPARLGLLNPAEVIWELVPFSFVADWFLPIGDYLSALDAPMRFSHVGGTIGHRLQTKMTTLATRVNQTNLVWGGFAGHGSLIRVTRAKMNSAPAVSLNDLMFEAKLGASRVTSAVSLLTQQLSRLERGRH